LNASVFLEFVFGEVAELNPMRVAILGAHPDADQTSAVINGTATPMDDGAVGIF
jgi:hypothetical protein